MEDFLNDKFAVFILQITIQGEKIFAKYSVEQFFQIRDLKTKERRDSKLRELELDKVCKENNFGLIENEFQMNSIQNRQAWANE